MAFLRRQSKQLTPEEDETITPPGVIDTIGHGFALLVAHPWTIAPMLLMELLLLFGPDTRLAPATDALVSVFESHPRVEWLSPHIHRFGDVNALEAAGLQVPLMRLPGIAQTLAERDDVDLRLAGTLRDLPAAVVGVLWLLSLGLGFIITSWYRSLLATLMGRSDPARGLTLVSVVQRAGRMIAMLAVVIGAIVLVLSPVIAGYTVGTVAGMNNVELLLLLAFLPIGWSLFYFYFAIHAVFVNDLRPLPALKSSFQVVSRNFWQSLGFMSISLLLTTGLTFTLRALATNLPGALLALFLNAILMSGMITAAMVFYRDRANLIASRQPTRER